MKCTCHIDLTGFGMLFVNRVRLRSAEIWNW